LTFGAPDLHPLAIEDVVHQRNRAARSKADYYQKHLFLHIQSHTLASPDEIEPIVVPQPAPTIRTSNVTGLPRSASPSDFLRHHDEEIAAAKTPQRKETSGTFRKRFFSKDSTHHHNVEAPTKLDELEKAEDKVRSVARVSSCSQPRLSTGYRGALETPGESGDDRRAEKVTTGERENTTHVHFPPSRW
jgi:hypothetical protein